MTSSGTTAFNPAISDLTLEIFDRIQIRPSEITPDHLRSARMSFNLMLSTFSNKGVDLWTVDLQTISLVQGVATYSVPSDTIMILPGTYIRNYSLGSPTNITPTFTTTSSSATVNVYLPNNGLSVTNYINIIIPISVGGIILYGFYQVVSVLGNDNFTITAASNATSSTTGGAVPYFTTTATSTTVTVTLPNHGYLAGQPFVVQVSTLVGGVTLAGTYTIATIIDANNFTITSPYAAGSSATAYENSGDAQIATQQTTQIPIDRIMAPLSRDDYAALPNKPQQGFPTMYWFNRQINPTITLWEVPDGNGPYQLQYYRFTQIQDADAKNGQTLDVPYRFLEAFCSSVAFHLAMKWKPEATIALKAYADEVWASAAAEDRERVSLYMQPDLAGYYQY